MYAVYKYLNGATAANVLSDVVAILTGTTDVNTLSASCDKANSLITDSLAPSGWTLHDDAAGTNAKVIKAPIADNPSQFKYEWLSTNNAGYFTNALYENWNATAHTGTNMSQYDTQTAAMQRVNYSFATGGFLYISASARHLLIHSMSSGSTFGSTNGGASGCVEYTRWSPWDIVANGYLPCASVNYGCLQPGATGYVPRIKGTSGTDITGDACRGIPAPLTYTLPSSKIPDASGALIIPLIPIIMTGYTSGSSWYLGGNVSELTNVWYGPSSYGSMLDEFSLGTGTTYVIFSSSSIRIAVPKG